MIDKSVLNRVFSLSKINSIERTGGKPSQDGDKEVLILFSKKPSETYLSSKISRVKPP